MCLPALYRANGYGEQSDCSDRFFGVLSGTLSPWICLCVFYPVLLFVGTYVWLILVPAFSLRGHPTWRLRVLTVYIVFVSLFLTHLPRQLCVLSARSVAAIALHALSQSSWCRPL